MKNTALLAILFPVWLGVSVAQHPGWPRQITKQGNTLVYYQPQVNDWKNFAELSWRMAFSLTTVSSKEVVGVVEVQGHTDIDADNKVVLISNLKITGTRFPSLDPARSAQMDQLVREFLPPSVTISLHRLVAVVNKAQSVAVVPVNNNPPAIVVSYSPANLLSVDGEPILEQVPKTKLQFVVNTSWPLFFGKSKSSYYILVGQQWMTANSLGGPWSVARELPKDMSKVPKDPQWAALKNAIPLPAVTGGVIPQTFIATGQRKSFYLTASPSTPQFLEPN